MSQLKDIKFVDLRFSTSLGILDIIKSLMGRICEQMEFDEDSSYWIWLATQEALNNAIKHGNKMDKNKFVHLVLSTLDDEFTISVQDEGEGFDQSSIPDPTAPENLLKTSGRGLFFMRNFMDRVEIQINQGTKVTLTKKIKGSPS
ncbi:MAG: ATP-binding protein [Acidobacteria bacterium]|nr:ATP-binding protein [Acidobacteriota bacterium]MCB9397159.1 ATP-binding protein [Acidobacteriota bacterium]